MQNRYRAGVVGLSGISANRPAPDADSILKSPSPSSHLGAYHLVPQTDVVAVCDLKTELFEKVAQTWGQEFGELETYTDYRAMIERENLDLLSVCTSDHRHTDIVIAAANAGVKGIICEKPLATSVDEATRMIEACEASGSLLVVDHTNRWRPHYDVARQAIRDGSIGKVHRIVAHLGTPRAMMFRNGTHLIDGVCFLPIPTPSGSSGTLNRDTTTTTGTWGTAGATRRPIRQPRLTSTFATACAPSSIWQKSSSGTASATRCSARPA